MLRGIADYFICGVSRNPFKKKKGFSLLTCALTKSLTTCTGVEQKQRGSASNWSKNHSSLKACNSRTGRIVFLFAAKAPKFSWTSEVEGLRSLAVPLCPGGKSDLQPCVQSFSIKKAVLENVASGNWMAEYTGNELRVLSLDPLTSD